MKLLAFTINFHDSNISYFDGKKLRYYKHERSIHLKHAAITNVETVIGIVKEIWGLNFSDFDHIAAYYEADDTEDDIILVQGTYLDYSRDIMCETTLEINKNIFYKYNIEKVDHHLCHYLSGKFLTDKKIDYGFVFDGEGEPNVTGSIYKNNKLIKTLYESKNGSIGRLIEKLAVFCDIKQRHTVDGSGKLMSLQSFGNFKFNLYENLKNFDIYNFSEMETFIFSKDVTLKYNKLDIAKTVHAYIGEALLNIFRNHANEKDVIIYSGGVAQNIVWNTQLRKSFPNIIIPPYSSDEGLSLGALRYLMEKYECI